MPLGQWCTFLLLDLIKVVACLNAGNRVQAGNREEPCGAVVWGIYAAQNGSGRLAAERAGGLAGRPVCQALHGAQRACIQVHNVIRFCWVGFPGTGMEAALSEIRNLPRIKPEDDAKLRLVHRIFTMWSLLMCHRYLLRLIPSCSSAPGGHVFVISAALQEAEGEGGGFSVGQQ